MWTPSYSFLEPRFTRAIKDTEKRNSPDESDIRGQKALWRIICGSPVAIDSPMSSCQLPPAAPGASRGNPTPGPTWPELTHWDSVSLWGPPYPTHTVNYDPLQRVFTEHQVNRVTLKIPTFYINLFFQHYVPLIMFLDPQNHKCIYRLCIYNHMVKVPQYIPD